MRVMARRGTRDQANKCAWSATVLEAYLQAHAELTKQGNAGSGKSALMIMLERRKKNGKYRPMRSSDWESARLLLKYGGDWEATSKGGMSARMVMTKFPMTDVAKAKEQYGMK
jgi:hypothetical protein